MFASQIHLDLIDDQVQKLQMIQTQRSMRLFVYGDVGVEMKTFTQMKTYLMEEAKDQVIEFDLDDKSIEEIKDFLDSQGISYKVEDGFIYVDENDIQEEALAEGSAKRKLVIRNGRKKIILVCAPGKKKVGRSCIVRKSSELSKLKRRNKRSARKAKSKHGASARKRKKSNKRRATMGLTKKHESADIGIVTATTDPR